MTLVLVVAARSTRSATGRKARAVHSIPVTSTPTLLRKLGLLSATALVISNMIGVGVFGTTGFIAGDLGTPNLVLLIWVVGALCALCGAICYSELGINF